MIMNNFVFYTDSFAIMLTYQLIPTGTDYLGLTVVGVCLWITKVAQFLACGVG
jgi:hypothetical protein